MRFKLTLARDPKHLSLASSLGWLNSDELISCADDHQLLKWNLISGEAISFCTLPDTLYPTDIHWFPRGLTGGGGGNKKAQAGSSDLFVLTSADGRFYLISKSGRVEKSVEAHKGAVLSARWSYDGSSLLTVGEDGVVKIWSRNGMLRSTLAQNPSPVYAGVWAADNGRVLFCCAKQLTIKSLQANAKPSQWKAHEGVVTAIDWSALNGHIVSGGEDCKFKVWDEFGRPLFTSAAHEFPITAVAWSPEGDLFSVGSYNMLRLCDKAGWSHSMEKPRTGSIFNIRWSPDGTQLAGACGNGHVIHANVIEQRVEWRNLEAIQTKRKTVEVRDVMTEGREKLEMKDRVTKMALGFDKLVVTTVSQCLVFGSHNWNTPIITDLKEGSVSLIVMASKIFLLVDGSQVSIHTYDGRLQCHLKLQQQQRSLIGCMSERTVALSNDTAALRGDSHEEKIIYLFDCATAKQTGHGKIAHTQEIQELAIDQCGSPQERKVAFLDKNNDCFLCVVKSYGTANKIVKIGAMVHNIRFNDVTNMLVGLQDGKLLVWCYPAAAYVDRELLPKTIISKETSDFGKSPTLISFAGNHVTARREDGSRVGAGLSPFPAALHAYIDKSKWDQALRLCRHIRDEKLWATLAAMASYAKNLNTAEIAYGAIDEAEKVQLLGHIRSNPNKEVRGAEMALFCGNVQDAEGLLLQTGHIFRAIMLNITLYKWDRALELAVKNKQHVDTVLGYRQRYLQEFEKSETRPKFIQYTAEVEVDWDQIEERMEAEYEKERTK